jgi:hypothetical protein
MIKQIEHIDEYYDSINTREHCLAMFETSMCKVCHSETLNRELIEINDCGNIRIIRMEMNTNDQFQELAGKLRILAAPTFILYYDGQEEHRWTGVNKREFEELKDLLKGLKEDLK